MRGILVNIDVPDLGAAERFYCAAFGLEPARRLGDGVVELVGASARVYLLAKAAGTRATPAADAVRTYARHWTPVHVDFVVDDIDAAVTRAVTAGAERESECIEWRGSRCVSFSDPFGHGFCLIEFSGDGYQLPTPSSRIS